MQPPERFSPDDPREWLNRARSNLIRAKSKLLGVYLEDLCFDAQQAAEKAIKALLIKREVVFPYVHDLARLVTLLEAAGQEIPAAFRRCRGGDRQSQRGRPKLCVSSARSHRKYGTVWGQGCCPNSERGTICELTLISP